jgi:hypothetical protein
MELEETKNGAEFSNQDLAIATASLISSSKGRSTGISAEVLRDYNSTVMNTKYNTSSQNKQAKHT